MGSTLVHSTSLLIAAAVIWSVMAGSVDKPFEVGTWANFCKGAASHTFDDNTGNQLSKGVPMFNEKGFHMTMFIIVNQISNWSAYNKAFQEGHEIASHSNSHNGAPGEYKSSQQTIQKNVPGELCVSYAHPYCNVQGDATSVYVAARNCSDGNPNPATPKDFGNIQSQLIGNQQGCISGVDKLNAYAEAAATKNGWAVYLHHGIDGDHTYSTSSSELKGNLEYLAKNRSILWCETFGNVARYIKERDAVSVKQKKSDNTSITIEVTDALDNKVYNYPLSLRLPVEDTWGSPNAQQDGKDVKDTVITFDGKKYFMFQAVPDDGDVVITTGGTTGIKNRFGLNNKPAVSRLRSSLVINRQIFNGDITVTLFNLAGKVSSRHMLRDAESTIPLCKSLAKTVFIAQVTDAATACSYLFTPD